jgi:SAM-dependent methyltransferase
MTEGYKSDLAYIHDVGFGGFVKSASAVVLELLQDKGFDSGLVVDLGCGSGILAQELENTGYDVLGIDISTALLAIARKRVKKANFSVCSLFNTDIPDCIAVAAIGECFNYLFDSNNTAEKLYNLFVRIYNALNSGGMLIFDVASKGRIPGSGLYRTYTEGEDWAVLMTAEEDSDLGLLTRHITTFRKVGELYRRDGEVHQLRLLMLEELVEQLQNIGFEVSTFSSYGQLQLAPGHMGLLAQKQG